LFGGFRRQPEQDKDHRPENRLPPRHHVLSPGIPGALMRENAFAFNGARLPVAAQIAALL
jgi:hypothetical protein